MNSLIKAALRASQAAALGLLVCGSVHAEQVDGITLQVRYGATPTAFRLQWTGGQPDFSVYRSTKKDLVVAPGNLLGETSVRSWLDDPASGKVYFYEITSPCVFSPPEVCDGIDNDCDGMIDGPGSETSCHLPHAGAACFMGSCSIAGCLSGFSDCDGVAANGCETAGACANGCDGANSLWSASLGTGAASAPVNDTPFNISGGSFSYIAKGSRVTSFYNVDSGSHAAGSVSWTKIFPATIFGSPIPAPLQSLEEAVFVSASNGLVYRLDASTGDFEPGFPFDTRRPSCVTDSIVASPAVQLRAYSNASFQSAQADDLVFVITRSMCSGGDQQNRVFALHASDGTLAWVFDPNTTSGLPMGFGSEGCTLDYDTNRLYCGTSQPGAQRTLWAIDTTNGSLLWSRDVGAVLNRPQLRGTRLYVAANSGVLWSLDAATGATHWSTPVTTTASVVRNPWVVDGGFFDGLVLITDTAGFLHGIRDTGSAGVVAWPATNPFGTIVTMPVASANVGRAWVGTANGILWQINLGTGFTEARGTAGSGAVYDPALDIDGLFATDVNRLITAGENSGSGSSQLRRYCVPWVPGSVGLD